MAGCNRVDHALPGRHDWSMPIKPVCVCARAGEGYAWRDGAEGGGGLNGVDCKHTIYIAGAAVAVAAAAPKSATGLAVSAHPRLKWKCPKTRSVTPRALFQIEDATRTFTLTHCSASRIAAVCACLQANHHKHWCLHLSSSCASTCYRLVRSSLLEAENRNSSKKS